MHFISGRSRTSSLLWLASPHDFWLQPRHFRPTIQKSNNIHVHTITDLYYRASYAPQCVLYWLGSFNAICKSKHCTQLAWVFAWVAVYTRENPREKQETLEVRFNPRILKERGYVLLARVSNEARKACDVARERYCMWSHTRIFLVFSHAKIFFLVSLLSGAQSLLIFKC